MIDLKKHNDNENDENNEENESADVFGAGIIIILLVICALTAGLAVYEFADLIRTDITNGVEGISYVPDKVFSLTVSGKSENNVTETYVLAFADDEGTSRSFTVPKELFDRYEVGNQAEITVDYQEGAFLLDNEDIEEIKRDKKEKLIGD